MTPQQLAAVCRCCEQVKWFFKRGRWPVPNSFFHKGHESMQDKVLLIGSSNSNLHILGSTFQTAKERILTNSLVVYSTKWVKGGASKLGSMLKQSLQMWWLSFKLSAYDPFKKSLSNKLSWGWHMVEKILECILTIFAVICCVQFSELALCSGVHSIANLLRSFVFNEVLLPLVYCSAKAWPIFAFMTWRQNSFC